SRTLALVRMAGGFCPAFDSFCDSTPASALGREFQPVRAYLGHTRFRNFSDACRASHHASVEPRTLAPVRAHAVPAAALHLVLSHCRWNARQVRAEAPGLQMGVRVYPVECG